MLDDKISIIIPTSPIKSHPNTTIIDQTIASVRFHFPTAIIWILMDGVRVEQEHYREQYTEFKSKLRANADANTRFLEFENHTHQVGMTKAALREITTPLILFVEHDTPLVTDEPIEWAGILATVETGEANVVRLFQEAGTLAPHAHLMGKIVYIAGVRLKRTIQWSQRPHVARTDFYRMILNQHFSIDANTMIEDGIYHVLTLRGEWEYGKVMIYCPNDTNIKRSYTTDGRGDDEKYDKTFTF